MNKISRMVLAAGLFILLPVAGFAAEPVYVPLGDANAIAEINPAQGTVVGKIEGVPAVHGLAATPDGKYLIAGSFQERTPASAPPSKPTGMSESEHASHHMKQSPGAQREGQALSTVSIIRVEDKSIIRRIDVPGVTHHVAVSPDGRLAVVTHPNNDSISAIDLKSYRVLRTVHTGPLPNYAAFSPDSSHLYVSNAGNNTVSDIDVSNWIVSRNIIVGEGPEHLVLSLDGKQLYVNDANGGTVSVIDTSSDKVVKTIKIGAVLHGIDLSKDGQTLFVSVFGGNQVAAIDLATSRIRTAPLAPEPYHLAVIRGTGQIYVTSASEPKIWVLDPDTLNRTKEIVIGKTGHQIAQVGR